MSWKSDSLGNLLADLKPGFASGDNLEEGVFQLRMNNVSSSGQLDLSKRRRVRVSAKQIASTMLRAGDVVFNATNSPELVGKSTHIASLDEPTSFSNHFLRLRVNESVLDARFLAHFLQMQFQLGTFQRLAKRWVNQAAVSRESLEQLEVALPPLPEQRRISAILDRVEELRAKRRQTMTLIDELAGSLFADMSRAESIENKEMSFGDLIASVQNGTYVPSSGYGSGTPILRIADFGGGELLSLGNLNRVRIPKSEAERYALSPHDLLVNRVNAMSHVGKAAMVATVPERTVFESNMMRIRLRTALVAPEYALAWLQTPNARRQIRSSAKQAINQASVNQTDIASLRLPLPSRDVQSDFVKRLYELQGLRASQRTHLAKLDELFASLQHRAFTGQL